MTDEDDCENGANKTNGRMGAQNQGLLQNQVSPDSRGSKMRMWLLFVLFVCLSGALYLSFGTPEYSEKASELVGQLEDM